MRGHRKRPGRVSRSRRALAAWSAWLVAVAFFVVAPMTQAAASGSVTVQASPTSGTAGVDISSLEAMATLSGTTAPPTSTSVAFTLYSNSTCNTPVPGVTGTGSLDSLNDTATYSQDWTPPMAGTYYWEASYSDSINGTATSVCSDPSGHHQPGDDRPGVADADHGGDADDGGGGADGAGRRELWRVGARPRARSPSR